MREADWRAAIRRPSRMPKNASSRPIPQPNAVCSCSGAVCSASLSSLPISASTGCWPRMSWCSAWCCASPLVAHHRGC